VSSAVGAAAISAIVGLGWLVSVLWSGYPRIGRRARRRYAAIAIGCAAIAWTAYWRDHAFWPSTNPGLAPVALTVALGAWAWVAAEREAAYRSLSLGAAVSLMTGGALAVLGRSFGPPVGASRGWFLASEAILALASGSLLSSAVLARSVPGDGQSLSPDAPLHVALALGVGSLMAYGIGAQRALGTAWPGSPSMSHRVAAVLVMALLVVGGKRRSRATRLLGGLFCLVVLFGSSALSAWLQPAVTVIYP